MNFGGYQTRPPARTAAHTIAVYRRVPRMTQVGQGGRIVFFLAHKVARVVPTLPGGLELVRECALDCARAGLAARSFFRQEWARAIDKTGDRKKQKGKGRALWREIPLPCNSLPELTDVEYQPSTSQSPSTTVVQNKDGMTSIPLVSKV